MDKLHAMAVFVEIAERGSLTAAAGALDASLPSIVRTLATLEAALGVRLFNRSTRRIAITDEGRVYLAHCKRIRAAVEDAEQDMGRTRTEPAGLITLTAPVMFGEMYVAPLLAGFLRAHPRVEVNLVLLDRVVDLLHEGIDLAVRIAPVPDSNLVAWPVARLRKVICASPALVARTQRPAEPQALTQLPCIRFTGLGELSSWAFHRPGAPQAKPLVVDVHGPLVCNSAGASLAACIGGAGFGRFLCYQVMPAVRSGSLEIVLEDYEPPLIPLTLIYPHNRAQPARMRAFTDWLTLGLQQALKGRS